VTIKKLFFLISIFFFSIVGYPQNLDDDNTFTCAIVAFNEGLYELSLDFLNQYFQKPESQKNDYAVFLYAINLLKIGRYQESLVEFEKLIKYFPDSSYKKDAWIYTINLEILLNMPYDAWQTYISGIPYFGKNSEIEKNLGHLLLNQIGKSLKENEIEKAKNLLNEMDQVLSDTEIKQEIKYYDGLILYEENNFESCLGKLTEVLPYFGAQEIEPEILLKIGDCFFNLKNYQESQNYYTKIIKKFPKSGQAEWAKLQLSLVYKKMLRYKDAKKLLTELVNNTKNEDILLRCFWELGKISELDDKKQEAIFWYEQIINLSKNDQLTLNTKLQIGYIYLNQKEYEKAIQCFSEYLQYKNNYDVRYAAGLAYYNSGQITKSMDIWGNILEENSDYPIPIEVLKEMYNFYKKNSDNIGMKKIFLKIWKDYPDDSFILTEGLLFLNEIINKGEIEEAVKYIKNIDPKRNPEINFLKAKLLYLSGNLEASEQILNTIEKKSLFAAEALYLLGEINLKKSKIKDAQACYIKIIASFPKSIWAQKAKEALANIKSEK